MKRLLFIFTMIAISVLSVSAQSDYYIKKHRVISEKQNITKRKLMAIVAKLHTISKRQKDTSMMQLITQKEATWIVRRHTLVMRKTRWISMKHNCDMRPKQMIKLQCIFVGLLMH